MGTVLNSLSYFNEIDTQITNIANNVSITINQFNIMERSIQAASRQQENFSDKVEETRARTDILDRGLALMTQNLSFQKMVDLADSMVRTRARIDAMNSGLQTTDQLQKKIFTAAQQSRTPYAEMAETVTNMGIAAKSAFKTDDDVIVFVEQVKKEMILGGLAASEQASAMDTLIGAMADGSLEGSALNTVLNAAPGIGENIEKTMGWAAGSLTAYAEEGQVTADVVRNAMFTMADDTNSAFAEMPMTWEQAFGQFGNKLLQLAQPMLSFLTLLSNNWSLIEPFIWGAVAALTAYGVILTINKGLTMMSATATAIHAAFTSGWTMATLVATAAQKGLNVALQACPITWIIIGIIAIIALFYAAVAALNKWAGTSLSATGIICGALAVAGAFIANVFIAAYNFMADMIVGWYNIVGAFANFFANFLNDPVGAIIRLLASLAHGALDILGSIASGIDTIFGSNLAGQVEKWSSGLDKWVNKKFEETTVEIMPRLNSSDFHMDRLDYGAAWDTGHNFGSNLFSGLSAQGTLGLEDNSQSGGAQNPVSQIADNTGRMADSMSVSEEELKYMRDVAEQEAINRFTTAEIKVDMNNTFGDVRESADIDGVINRLTEKLEQQLAVSAEGVYV